MTAAGPPLLVTGLPRSGTSWVGKMLEASGRVVYINEPLNVRHPPGRSPGVLDVDVEHRFPYICRDNEEAFLPGFSDLVRLRYRVAVELRRNRSPYDLARLAKYFTAFTVGRITGRRPMMDDPYALFSISWLAERFGFTVIVLMRDPAAVAGSWQRLGWTIDLRELLGQPLLMRDLLGVYESDMRAAGPDHLARIATLWRVAYAAVETQRRFCPNAVHIRKYEDLARNPVDEFRELYDRLGLPWSDRVRRRIVAATSKPSRTDRPFAWERGRGMSRTAFRRMDSSESLNTVGKGLSADQVAMVRRIVSKETH